MESDSPPGTLPCTMDRNIRGAEGTVESVERESRPEISSPTSSSSADVIQPYSHERVVECAERMSPTGTEPPTNSLTSGITTPFVQGKRVLYLFSGPAGRTDGLAAFLREYGIDTQEADLCNLHMQWQDILDDSVWQWIRHQLSSGHFHFVFASPPCRSEYACLNVVRKLDNFSSAATVSCIPDTSRYSSHSRRARL